MATTNILPFVPVDTGTNLLTDAAYLAASDRTNGQQPGVASSKLNNKALRQSSLMAAGLAQFLADRQATNVVDTLTPVQIAAMLAASASGRLLRTLVYLKIAGVQNVIIDGAAPTTTGATTYTPSATMSFIIGEAQGGGNAGGGAASTTTGLISMGSAGGSGGYGKGKYLAAAVGASAVITVGSAGAQNVGAAGGAGGSSSIGALLSAPGGLGSGTQNNVTSGPVIFGNGSLTAAATGANLYSVKGGCNNNSICVTNGAVSGFLGGTGGFSVFGVGGPGTTLNAPAGPSSGNYGTGGGGVFLSQSSPSVSGGAATDGIVIIQEFA